MTANGYVQLALYMIVLLLLAKPLGGYMARVYQGRPTGLDGAFGWLERLIYRVGGVRPDAEMGWKRYTIAMLLFNFAGILVVYALQRLQGSLPLNPQGLGAVSPDSSFNTAVSFGTNTNWQGYGGETTMSYLTQMLGLTVQNFVSAAAGMATLAAFIRGLSRRSSETIGNFWVDLTRTTLYILLPLSFVLALVLVSQGVVQTLRPLREGDGRPADPVRRAGDRQGRQAGPGRKGQPKMKKETLTEQVLALGPAASQIAIKQLGTNGGGFFNVNSAHPFENATPLSNFLELLGDPRDLRRPLLHLRRHGRGHAPGLGRPGGDDDHVRRPARGLRRGRAARHHAGVARGRPPGQRAPVGRQHGGQGGPLRDRQLGPVGHRHHGRVERLGQLDARLLHAARRPGPDVAHAARRGRLRRRRLGPLRDAGVRDHRRLRRRPDGRADARVPGQEDRGLRDEDGGPGDPHPAGGRHDRDRGRGGQPRRHRRPSSTRAPTASARSSTPSPRPGNNNGSAFAGLGANTPFYNTALGFAMLFARYWLAIPTLAIAGSLARKKTVPAGPGHPADAHPALRGAPDRGGRAGRGAHVHPRARAGTDRRAPPDDRP